VKTLCSAFIFFTAFNASAQSPAEGSPKARQLPVACDSTGSLNSEILKVVKPCIGKKIDRGECWDLAKFALDKVNASWDGFMDFGKEFDWKKECLQPGDILQFEGVVFEGKNEAYKYSESFYHHTAIVYSIGENGEVELIHQNTGQYGKKVGVSTIYFKDLKKGKIQAYRPVV